MGIRQVNRSTRHAKICGNFFENLVLYVLSRNGFETALVDHTGIDILARNPISGEYLGISVKGRTRNSGERAGRVKIDNFQDHLDKIDSACVAFGNATPYLAVLVDANNEINGTLVPVKNVKEKYWSGDRNLNWGMGKESLNIYKTDPDTRLFTLKFGDSIWF